MGAVGTLSFFFAIICFFFNHSEELQTVLFEVELIIHYKPLRYVYPNTSETCFTPNHLLFDRQSLYSIRNILRKVRHLL